DVFQNSSLYFLFGFLVYILLTSWFAFFILKFKNSKSENFSILNLVFQNLKFDFKRNIVITSIISIGIFIVISTGANRVDFNRNADKNSSGTGGYDFYIETNIGLNADLSTAGGLENLGISEYEKDLHFVQLLRYKSDDASCLNLNRIIQPSILGVKPDKLIERNSFSFEKTRSAKDSSTWDMLRQPMSANCIPAVGDQTVITWGLGKSLGDSVVYTSERGDTIYLVLVGGLKSSVFQGNLLISEENFVKHFPSISGSNIILVDSKSQQLNELKVQLEGALQTYGANIESAPERLATFNSVTNTYLDIFLALGGIALILGTFGIAIILISSIQTRKNNYAMMQAFGINQKSILKAISIEFLIVLFAGIIIGLLAAIAASLQNLITTNADVPYLLLTAIVLIFAVSGFSWIIIGSKLSVKSKFITNLRNE
ncbi:MAG TPA: hypothetical protein P5084_12875, partial [Paludibacter sp.]|nr:hypothetical protein [Paludibacter sp.]